MSAADLAKLDRVAAIANPNGALAQILAEARRAAKKVQGWTDVPTSGSAFCYYDPKTGNPLKYDVRFQFGDLANMVHELTHISVNESYRRDFVNYKSTATVPKATYDAKGACTNEADRQLKWTDFNEHMARVNKLQQLSALAQNSSLSTEQKDKVVKQFAYGVAWASREYDTVLNQILVWMYDWGYPALVDSKSSAPSANALYDALEQAVMAAYKARNT